MSLFTINSALSKQCEYRRGFVYAIERRLFPSLPPMATPAEMQTYRESTAFQAGEEFGKRFFLPCKEIHIEISEYEDDAQWRLPAIASFFGCMLAMVVLWWVSTP
jgi:hypothetical protein